MSRWWFFWHWTVVNGVYRMILAPWSPLWWLPRSVSDRVDRWIDEHFYTEQL